MRVVGCGVRCLARIWECGVGSIAGDGSLGYACGIRRGVLCRRLQNAPRASVLRVHAPKRAPSKPKPKHNRNAPHASKPKPKHNRNAPSANACKPNWNDYANNCA
jgi:hypothetical protein